MVTVDQLTDGRWAVTVAIAVEVAGRARNYRMTVPAGDELEARRCARDIERELRRP